MLQAPSWNLFLLSCLVSHRRAPQNMPASHPVCSPTGLRLCLFFLHASESVLGPSREENVFNKNTTDLYYRINHPIRVSANFLPFDDVFWIWGVGHLYRFHSVQFFVATPANGPWRLVYVTKPARWWFQRFVFFHPTWGNDPI